MAFVHTVAQGECLSSIAKRYGFQSWKTIYDHPSNAEFKKKRKNPNVIHPGDQLVIPDKEQKEVDIATAKLHTFKVALPKAKVRVVLKDGKGKAFADKKYILSAGGQEIEGQTGGDGLVDQQVDADLGEADLTLFLDDTTKIKWRLHLGHLDPVDAQTGVHARLRNLGFDPGPDGGPIDALIAALKRFQARHGLTVNGDLDDPTKSKLHDLHDQK
jgi:hypothetical protein